MKSAKTKETAKKGSKSSACGGFSTAKNTRANGNKSAYSGAFKSSTGGSSRKATRKPSPAELRKEIGLLSVEFINCEE